MDDTLFYPRGVDVQKTATLGTVIDETEAGLVILAGGSSYIIKKEDTRKARVESIWEFWKAPGFILKPMTHVVVFALFFLFIF